MTDRKRVIGQWAECFAQQDWKRMLTLFTDDIERWEVGAPNRTHGKAEFERDVLPGPEVARLGMQVDRMIEEGNVVVADGTAQVVKKDGATINIQFCDIFEFDGDKVRRITAYGAVV
ncbi:MAG TPA: nuclear transport factor 2 family protein [Thermoplasmata archaeon]|nr:nuclear transport factor 2 family protein [Thermoplasmata archaeon]